MQRSDTLLVEYKQLKRANAFVDRRFGGAPLDEVHDTNSDGYSHSCHDHGAIWLANSGPCEAKCCAEHDNALTEDEKAIARFQKERLRKARQRAPLLPASSSVRLRFFAGQSHGLARSEVPGARV